jgi:hypothetical protein
MGIVAIAAFIACTQGIGDDAPPDDQQPAQAPSLALGRIGRPPSDIDRHVLAPQPASFNP